MNILLNLELMELMRRSEWAKKKTWMTNKNKFKILNAITLTHVTNVGFQLLCLHQILLTIPSCLIYFIYSHKMLSNVTQKMSLWLNSFENFHKSFQMKIICIQLYPMLANRKKLVLIFRKMVLIFRNSKARNFWKIVWKCF